MIIDCCWLCGRSVIESNLQIARALVVLKKKQGFSVRHGGVLIGSPCPYSKGVQ